MCWEFYSKHETFFSFIYLFGLCFYFILFSFDFLKDPNYFFLTQDERTGQMTYLDTMAPPPKLE